MTKDAPREKWLPAAIKTDRRQEYVVDRLINQSQEAEGPNLPPPIVRGIRVQPPSGFHITRQQEQKYASRFLLAWTPNDQMVALGAKYRIYTYAQQNVMPMTTAQSINQPGWTGPLLADVVADTSPCEVVIRGFRAQPVIFAIETRLPNGFVSIEESRPTCTGHCNPLYNNVTTVTAAYTATIDDETILADATGGSFAVNLFDCRQLPPGFTYTIKKLNAGNTVTWTPFLAAQTIDGAASIASTTQYEFFNIRTDGAVWHKV